MKIGDIDVPLSILDLERRMSIIEQLLQFITDNNKNLKLPSLEQFQQFNDEAIEVLQKKYPGMGITKKD